MKETDDDESLVQYDPKDLVQIAVRANRSVRINRTNWLSLSLENKVGILMHEALYALIQLDKNGEGYKQSSPRVRAPVGHIFSNEFSIQNKEAFLNLSNEYFPNETKGTCPEKGRCSILPIGSVVDLRIVIGISMGAPDVVVYKNSANSEVEPQVSALCQALAADLGAKGTIPFLHTQIMPESPPTR